MSLNSDTLYTILSYLEYSPKYKLICKNAVQIDSILYEDYMKRIDTKYPLWNRLSKSDKWIQGIYSIPIYQLNNAALDREWNIFMIMVKHHGYKIGPAALLITHMFERFDLSDKIIRLLTLDKLISLVDLYNVIETHKYMWDRGIYQFLVLYYLFKHNHVKKSYYAKEWKPSRSSPYYIIGFIHPDMKRYLEYFPLEPYVGNTKIILDSYYQGNGVTCDKQNIFLEYPCVNKDMFNRFGNIDQWKQYGWGNINPIWIRYQLKNLSTGSCYPQWKIDHFIKVYSDNVSSAYKLAAMQAQDQKIDESILNLQHL